MMLLFQVFSNFVEIFFIFNHFQILKIISILHLTDSDSDSDSDLKVKVKNFKT